MAYATLEDLKARLDWTLDPDEERIGAAALEDASVLAAHYGRDWPDGSEPRMVRTLVLKACKRYMDNPSGYTQSRAGDETLAWNDDAGTDAGTVYFTDDEQELIASLAGRASGFGSVPVVAWGTDLCRPYQAGQRPPSQDNYVPVEGGGAPFPFYADGGPW